jgi:hypothetical protein
MEFAEVALELAREMMRRSGVREWQDGETWDAILQSACDGAAAILAYQSEESEPMAKELYILEGTTLLIAGEVGADYAWSMEGIANGAGRLSAQIDLGADPRPYMYRWRCQVKYQATPTANTDLRLRKVESDGTYADDGLGESDAAVATEPVNAKQFHTVKTQAAGTQVNIGGGLVEIYEQYVSFVGWNASGATTDATDSNFKFFLTPISDQQQA